MRTRRLRAIAALAFAICLATFLTASSATGSPSGAPAASAWTLVKFVQTQPACTGAGFQGAQHYNRLECGFGYMRVSVDGQNLPPTPPAIVKVSFIDRDGKVIVVQTTTRRTTAGSEGWQFTIQPTASWPAGPITIRVTDVDPDGAGPQPNQQGNFGEAGIILNALGARVAAEPGDYAPGTPVNVNGEIYEIEHVSLLVQPREIPVPASVKLQVRAPSGEVRGPYGPFTADAQGRFSGTLPASATAGLTATPDTNFKKTLAIEAVDATYSDPVTGQWSSRLAGSGALPLVVQPDTLLIHNSFVSPVGWVKPGESYPFRVMVRNYTDSAATNAVVTIPAADGTTFTDVAPQDPTTTATISGGTITWNLGTVPAGADGQPALRTLLVQARADTTGQDPQVVWKNLSSTATLAYDGGPTLHSTSRGPKVIPSKASSDTARYGDRPFAVVTADYFDRKHNVLHTGEALREKINSADIVGSTFNLYQEMSHGQLFPNGAVPASSLASAGWDVQWKSDRYKQGGWQFTEPVVQGACYGTSYKDFAGSSVYSERIHNGWYQLPGDTAYYGGDADSFGNIAVPQSDFIDNACGPTQKAVYDAAHIADPEIDYSDYDTDKDGVVDFFMLVFVGEGGNGASQTSVPPYDNIWPHSFSLEYGYSDPETGLTGYISDDQLEDLEGRPMYYTDSTRSVMTTNVTDYPVYVRVGPYNVNPESAIDHASVISHEYGHSLGLPDYYSSPAGSRDTYADWNLMATDKSQNMDLVAREELGWIIPRVLQAGQTVATGMRDGKTNTHRIDWVQPDGTPYTLQGPRVNNGEAYVAKLPGKRLMDPAKVPSGTHLWWSQAGDDFGCTPDPTAHVVDIYVPALAQLPAGTPVTLTFKSMWDLEWDYDHGFVMAALRGDNGAVSYESIPSENGYTTEQSFNPHAIPCQLQYGNGITGSSGSYAAGTQDLDRQTLTEDYPDPVFLADGYDLTAYAGRSSAIRLSYTTDGGVAHPGWFVDDLTIRTGSGTVLYSSDFESSDDPAIYNGGCNKDGLSTSDRCSAGWRHLDAGSQSEAEHAYLLEMRDRSGFDMEGHGENDRDAIQFAGGLYLGYTNEAAGYGNAHQGDGDAPNQSPLDSQPQPGNITPNLHDAAFTAAAGDNAFSDSITAARPGGWVDNYKDATTEYADGNWHFDFGCLTFRVDRMTGDGLGPSTAPGDLEGDVTFTVGGGCGAFDYGYGVPNQAPTAVASAKPSTVDAGDPVTLDGSESYDDIQPSEDLGYSWDTDGDGTFDANGRTVVHTYASPGVYTATLKVTDNGGLSSTDTVTVTVRGADLKVTSISASNAKPKEGDRVTLTATVSNNGSARAAASKTKFVLDGSTAIATVDTAAIPAGGSATVSTPWSTRGVKGDHVITVTADSAGTVSETNESNNSSTLAVSIKGNKVENGSFDQPNDSGSAPSGWSGSNTSAGTTSYGSGGTEGSNAASASGNGGNAATGGSPSWSSSTFPVAAGELLDVSAAVQTSSLSSAPSLGLTFIGPAGNVIGSVKALTAPLTTIGFTTLSQTVPVPLGAAQARIVLTAFAPTDTHTAGTVTFDDVGVFSQ
jgi:immune inhibitor A